MGIDLMVSVQTMGLPRRLPVLWRPTQDSVQGASSPQSSDFCASLRSGLASTKKTESMAAAMGGNRDIVWEERGTGEHMGGEK